MYAFTFVLVLINISNYILQYIISDHIQVGSCIGFKNIFCKHQSKITYQYDARKKFWVEKGHHEYMYEWDKKSMPHKDA